MNISEKDLKCNFCDKPATWMTSDMFDIRTCCDRHKPKLEEQVASLSPT